MNAMKYYDTAAITCFNGGVSTSSREPIAELRSVTCHTGSRSVTCHPTRVNAPHLNPSQTGRYSTGISPRDGRLSWVNNTMDHYQNITSMLLNISVTTNVRWREKHSLARGRLTEQKTGKDTGIRGFQELFVSQIFVRIALHVLDIQN